MEIRCQNPKILVMNITPEVPHSLSSRVDFTKA